MMTSEIKKILIKIINHYEMDIQWWDNDEEEQAYLEVDKVRDFLNIITELQNTKVNIQGVFTNEEALDYLMKLTSIKKIK